MLRRLVCWTLSSAAPSSRFWLQRSCSQSDHGTYRTWHGICAYDLGAPARVDATDGNRHLAEAENGNRVYFQVDPHLADSWRSTLIDFSDVGLRPSPHVLKLLASRVPAGGGPGHNTRRHVRVAVAEALAVGLTSSPQVLRLGRNWPRRKATWA